MKVGNKEQVARHEALCDKMCSFDAPDANDSSNE